MNNKAVIVTAVIASILVVGMISPIGPVYAHVNVCSSTNDHDKDGIPFSALWAAVCDLQSQIDNLQNQINNIHGSGSQSNVVLKQVQLIPAAGCTPAQILNPFSQYGWCPDGNTIQFLIHDDSVGPTSVISTSVLPPTTDSGSGAQCSVAHLHVVTGNDSGFLIICSPSPIAGTIMNYIIFNPSTPNTCTAPQVLQNGVCVTPPVTCTAPQVLQNGVCVTPPVTCTAPQVLDKTTNTCITPTQDDDKDKKQGSNSQFTNYKNENRH